MKNKSKRNSKASIAIIRSKTTDKLYLAMLIDEHPYKVWNMSDLSPAALDFLNELMRAYDLGYIIEAQLPTVVEGVRQIIPYIYSLDDGETVSKNAIKGLIDKMVPPPEISDTYNAECDNAIIREKCDITNDTINKMAESFVPQENEVQFAPDPIIATAPVEELNVAPVDNSNDAPSQSEVSCTAKEESPISEEEIVDIRSENTPSVVVPIGQHSPEEALSEINNSNASSLEPTNEIPVLPHLETIDIPEILTPDGIYSIHYDGDVYSIEYKDIDDNIVTFDAGIRDKITDPAPVAKGPSEVPTNGDNTYSTIHENENNRDVTNAESIISSSVDVEKGENTTHISDLDEPCAESATVSETIGLSENLVIPEDTDNKNDSQVSHQEKVCPNGHGNFKTGEFCSICGARLVSPSTSSDVKEEIVEESIDSLTANSSMDAESSDDLGESIKSLEPEIIPTPVAEAANETEGNTVSIENATQVEGIHEIPETTVTSIEETIETSSEEPDEASEKEMSEEDAFFSDFLASYKKPKKSK